MGAQAWSKRLMPAWKPLISWVEFGPNLIIAALATVLAERRAGKTPERV
jgi:hypothetical protein